MVLWLIEAADVAPSMVAKLHLRSEAFDSWPSKSAAIRRFVPCPVLGRTLRCKPLTAGGPQTGQSRPRSSAPLQPRREAAAVGTGGSAALRTC